MLNYFRPRWNGTNLFSFKHNIGSTLAWLESSTHAILYGPRFFGGRDWKMKWEFLHSYNLFLYNLWKLKKLLSIWEDLIPCELTVVLIALPASSAGRWCETLAVLAAGTSLHIGIKSQTLLRAGWEITSCWERVYHKNIHDFSICFQVIAVFVFCNTSLEFHTLTQTELLALLPMIRNSSSAIAIILSHWRLVSIAK